MIFEIHYEAEVTLGYPPFNLGRIFVGFYGERNI